MLNQRFYLMKSDKYFQYIIVITNNKHQSISKLPAIDPSTKNTKL